MNGPDTRSRSNTRLTNQDKRCNILFVYDKDGDNSQTRNVISFTEHDYRSLRTPNFINDTVISFFIQYHLDHFVDDATKETIHVFNSFFYSKIKSIRDRGTNDCLKSASRWLKGVQIFDKDFLILPICEKDHWLLVIACYLSKIPGYNVNSKPDESLFEPAIFVLNSWRGCEPSIKKALKLFLRFQWKVERNVERSFVIHNAKKNGIKLIYPQLPQQKNNHNCGIYILNFLYCFLRDPRKSYLRMYRNLDMRRWFEENNIDITHERIKMIKIIQQQIAKHKLILHID